jgi:hypothetical protein
MLLEKNELIKTTGVGDIRYSIIIGVGGLITFLIGVFSGYVNPKKCNNK